MVRAPGDGGVYGVSRRVWDDPDFPDETYSEREAWLWLVGAAAWKAIRSRDNNGRRVAIERAEFSFALSFLATKFHWTKSKVERFLARLEKRDMLRDASRDGSKVYLIKNYNAFQIVGLPDRDANEAHTETPARRQRDKEEEGETLNTSSLRSEDAAEQPVVRTSRATRWPSEAVVPEDWIQAAGMKRVERGLEAIDLRYEAERFQNYWAAKSGGNATKVDWRLTWLNWATDREKTANGQRKNGYARAPKPSAHDNFLAGGAAYFAKRFPDQERDEGEGSGDQR